jgi:hypothetical protein
MRSGYITYVEVKNPNSVPLTLNVVMVGSNGKRQSWSNWPLQPGKTYAWSIDAGQATSTVKAVVKSETAAPACFMEKYDCQIVDRTRMCKERPVCPGLAKTRETIRKETEDAKKNPRVPIRTPNTAAIGDRG